MRSLSGKLVILIALGALACDEVSSADDAAPPGQPGPGYPDLAPKPDASLLDGAVDPPSADAWNPPPPDAADPDAADPVADAGPPPEPEGLRLFSGGGQRANAIDLHPRGIRLAGQRNGDVWLLKVRGEHIATDATFQGPPQQNGLLMADWASALVPRPNGGTVLAGGSLRGNSVVYDPVIWTVQLSPNGTQIGESEWGPGEVQAGDGDWLVGYSQGGGEARKQIWVTQLDAEGFPTNPRMLGSELDYEPASDVVALPDGGADRLGEPFWG
jgi:hypothetical protein